MLQPPLGVRVGDGERAGFLVELDGRLTSNEALAASRQNKRVAQAFCFFLATTCYVGEGSTMHVVKVSANKACKSMVVQSLRAANREAVQC